MGVLVELDCYRPHLTIGCDAGHIHVVPLRLFEEVANGHMSWNDADIGECVLRRIVAEWVACVALGYVARVCDRL